MKRVGRSGGSLLRGSHPLNIRHALTLQPGMSIFNNINSVLQEDVPSFVSIILWPYSFYFRSPQHHIRHILKSTFTSMKQKKETPSEIRMFLTIVQKADVPAERLFSSFPINC